MTFKAAAKSDPRALAVVLSKAIEHTNGDGVEIRAIGAGAVNQAMKAIAIARGRLVPSGRDIVCVPVFMRVTIDGVERTGLRIVITAKNGRP